MAVRDWIRRRWDQVRTYLARDILDKETERLQGMLSGAFRLRREAQKEKEVYRKRWMHANQEVLPRLRDQFYATVGNIEHMHHQTEAELAAAREREQNLEAKLVTAKNEYEITAKQLNAARVRELDVQDEIKGLQETILTMEGEVEIQDPVHGILHNTSVGTLVVNGAHEIVAAYPGIKTYTGMKPKELEGARLTDIAEGDDTFAKFIKHLRDVGYAKLIKMTFKKEKGRKGKVKDYQQQGLRYTMDLGGNPTEIVVLPSGYGSSYSITFSYVPKTRLWPVFGNGTKPTRFVPTVPDNAKLPPTITREFLINHAATLLNEGMQKINWGLVEDMTPEARTKFDLYLHLRETLGYKTIHIHVPEKYSSYVTPRVIEMPKKEEGLEGLADTTPQPA